MRKLLKFLFWFALVVGVIVGALRLTVLRWWRVPADDPQLVASIAPSLRGGDLVLLWRGSPPSFGDLVVCDSPEYEGEKVIGRIAAEARDSIEIKREQLTVNGSIVRPETACDERTFIVPHPTTEAEVEQHCDMEALGGRTHMRGQASDSKYPIRDVKTEVGEGMVFLVSDNRLFPYDSRHYGSVDRTTCKETVFFRLVSAQGYFDRDGRFTVVR